MSTERILVPFEGEGAGTGELTWGQQHIWQAMQERGSSLSLCAIRALGPGDSVEAIVAELQFYLRHFQTLRTRLRPAADGSPRLVVAGHGELPLDLTDVDDADPATIAESFRQQYEAEPFDHAEEWPLRAAVVSRHGAPARLVLAVSHLALDRDAARIMFRSRDPRTGKLRSPLTAPQPVELARIERSPARQRVHERAMRHWEKVVRPVVPARFPGPARPSPPRFREVRYESPALLLALRSAAGRGAGERAVLLAGFAVALARVTGINPVVTQVIVDNRFRSGLAEVVAPVNQPGLCAVDVAGATLDQAIERTQRAALAAYKHAYYHRPRLNELLARVNGERGQAVDLECFYNDRRSTTATLPPPDAVALRAAPPGRVVGQWPLERFNARLMLHVEDAPDSICLLAQVDDRYLPAVEETLLPGIEQAVVQAALDPTAATGV